VITAVDSSVIIDILVADHRYGQASRRALATTQRTGATIACDLVWAEVVAGFESAQGAASALERLGIEYGAVSITAAAAAGASWRAYRARGGRRERILSDFVIGAHAMHQADRLLTRDRGFYRTYFRKLQILDPGQAPT